MSPEAAAVMRPEDEGLWTVNDVAGYLKRSLYKSKASDPLIRAAFAARARARGRNSGRIPSGEHV